ncbi:unnamed protein product [Brachionus calyciflorus]|uniref:Uncharacterized protein n=1 Tax=Brachionus calyciflorus TaxID=104777 RepID=A0A813Q2H5_9BILA|nr:unnamed protein product [Brachionus calyciflorus]
MLNLCSELMEYYDNLQCQIDIETERRLMLSSLTNAEKNEINLIRQYFLNEINNCLNNSLSKLNRQATELKNYKVINRFVIFIKTKSEKLIGYLVVTNSIIKEATRNLLQIRNFEIEGHYDGNFLPKDLITKDYILAEILSNEINTKKNTSYKTNFLIDLSKPFIKKYLELYFDFDTKNLSANDFDLDSCFLDTKFLKNFNIMFGNTNNLIIEPRAFSSFTQIQNLDLIFNGTETFLDKNCFEGLENLKKLRVSFIRLESLNNHILNGMSSLKYLEFEASNLTRIENEAFKNLLNLKYLILDLKKDVKLHIANNAFYGLENLNFLSLKNSSKFDPKSLNVLKSLEFLELNEPLELDNLDLPSLKYLSIISKNVPKFKSELQFLEIKGLEDLDYDSFNNLKRLRGIRLTISQEALRKINREKFTKLSYLIYLSIYLDCDKLYQNESFKKKSQEFYKNYLNEKNVQVKFDHNYFQVSCYGKFEKILTKAINFNHISIDILKDFLFKNKF